MQSKWGKIFTDNALEISLHRLIKRSSNLYTCIFRALSQFKLIRALYLQTCMYTVLANFYVHCTRHVVIYSNYNPHCKNKTCNPAKYFYNGVAL